MTIRTGHKIKPAAIITAADITIFGKNPVTKKIQTKVDKAAGQKIESTEFQSSRVNGPSPSQDDLVKAIENACNNPVILDAIERRAETAKKTYEYFLGPQQYRRFKYKGRTYSLCSATNTPVDLELLLSKIFDGSFPSEPETT